MLQETKVSVPSVLPCSYSVQILVLLITLLIIMHLCVASAIIVALVVERALVWVNMIAFESSRSRFLLAQAWFIIQKC